MSSCNGFSETFLTYYNSYQNHSCWGTRPWINPTWYGVLNYLVVWGGGWKCPQGRMATEANWGQCRGYQSWQILFLTSFSICRAFEKSPMLYSFAVRGRRSHLLSPRKIISFSVYENPNFVNFWVIWTICTSNESWEHSEFKFDMKKCNLLWKIRRKSIFLIFHIGKIADLPTLVTRCS